jgi:hypothetical protein
VGDGFFAQSLIAVPEPMSIISLATGLALVGLLALGRRRGKPG